ncbi:MFS gliotoxin efflux transporter GliA [Penicillium canariense]|uniref:MFS gliotoxin efflux transporter GliA n=1 Tax=Penicillium canariense TaxID=189055 RepID=A0A9W9I5Q1_9EURO|nr:MFS gliotoxin efflux transporter GliA [Penicillium canariense]KAJ5167105.1 MFS gliotoxin efflux transporter GliA [Penicillium canariense]
MQTNIVVGLFAIISGFLIAINGYYTIFMAIESGICTIAAGLLYTMDVNIPLRKPLGYQVLLGVGQGLAIQVPVIVAQSFAKPEYMSPTTAIILFFQMTGGTICISSGQGIFINRLLYHLSQIAPHIDTNTVLAAGASQLRQVIPADQIEFVLRAYSAGLKDTFALGIALAGCGFLTSWVAPVKDLKKMDGLGVESELALGA